MYILILGRWTVRSRLRQWRGAELSRRVEKVVGYLRANMIAPNPTAIVKLTAG